MAKKYQKTIRNDGLKDIRIPDGVLKELGFDKGNKILCYAEQSEPLIKSLADYGAEVIVDLTTAYRDDSIDWTIIMPGFNPDLKKKDFYKILKSSLNNNYGTKIFFNHWDNQDVKGCESVLNATKRLVEDNDLDSTFDFQEIIPISETGKSLPGEKLEYLIKTIKK